MKELKSHWRDNETEIDILKSEVLRNINNIKEYAEDNELTEKELDAILYGINNIDIWRSCGYAIDI